MAKATKRGKHSSTNTPSKSSLPPDTFVSTEVSYIIDSIRTSELFTILNQAHDWLRQSWYPVFLPDALPYRAGDLKLGF